MELVNEFTVKAPIKEAWDILTDVERIAPCMPGAQLTEIEGDTYRGFVKVKVGPITAQFKGEAQFVERDEEHHKAVLKASGRDTGGKGNASALITAQLEAEGADSTHVAVTTDLTITGKVAQFGRGALADVSSKLINQFVEQLETTVLNAPADAAAATEAVAEPLLQSESPAEAPSASSTSASTIKPANDQPVVRKIEGPEAQPIDLLETAGGTMLKRILPLGVLAIILIFLIRRRGKD